MNSLFTILYEKKKLSRIITSAFNESKTRIRNQTFDVGDNQNLTPARSMPLFIEGEKAAAKNGKRTILI